VWCLPALVADSFPGYFFCPGAEKAIGVSLSGHTSMSGLKGASGFLCSCLQSLQRMLPRASGVTGMCESRYPETEV